MAKRSLMRRGRDHRWSERRSTPMRTYTHTYVPGVFAVTKRHLTYAQGLCEDMANRDLRWSVRDFVCSSRVRKLCKPKLPVEREAIITQVSVPVFLAVTKRHRMIKPCAKTLQTVISLH